MRRPPLFLLPGAALLVTWGIFFSVLPFFSLQPPLVDFKVDKNGMDEENLESNIFYFEREWENYLVIYLFCCNLLDF